MKAIKFQRLISISICIAMVVLMCPIMAPLTTLANEPDNPNDIADIVTVGENIYTFTGATEAVADQIPTGWTHLTSSNCNWLWNVGNGTLKGRIQSSNGGNGVDMKTTGCDGGVVFPAPNTSDYVLTVRLRIGDEKGNYGLMTNITDPLSSATGATLSYITLSTTSGVTTGKSVQYNRVGSGQYDKTEYVSSAIGNYGSAAIYPGAIVTMKAYSFNGSTYFYIDGNLISYGAQREPEEIKSLCGFYSSGADLRIVAVSIDTLINNDIRTKVMPGKSLYSFVGATEAVADQIPTGWTHLTSSNCNWLWNVGGTLKGRIQESNGGNGVDMKTTGCDGGAVFPAINTSDYVLSVKLRIGDDKGNYGLMTNIADPLSSATGATLSYITLSTTESVTTGTSVQYNRVGAAQYDKTEYAYSAIGSDKSYPIYPGAVVTMKAYSYKGYTCFYIDDELVSYGKQRDYDPDKSLCGVYSCNADLRIVSVDISEAVSKDITERATVGTNLYSYTGATQQTDTTVPSGWTQLTSSNCNWLYNIGGSITGKLDQWNGGNGVVLRNDGNGAAGVTFPSINTSDYVVTVQLRIGSDHGHYGLMTNIADPVTGATGATLSYIQLSTTSSVTSGNAVQYNRVGGGQYDKKEYSYSYIGSNNNSPIYPGAIVTMKAYSYDGCTYYYVNDRLVSYGAQKDPEEIKSLCGVYCYYTDLKIIAVSIDALNEVIAEETVADVDFENGSYTVGSPACNSEQWSVEYDSSADNHYLHRAAGNSEWYSWGFTIPDTELLPGRIYKASFKARSNKNVFLDYSFLSSRNYQNFCSDIYYTDKNRERLTADTWTDIETYFTAKTYAGGRNAYFRILTMLWNGTTLDFDDIVIEAVQGMSFCEYGNKYSAPHIVDENGSTLTALPGDPERQDYIFNGWYLDGSALTTGTTVKGYKKAYASWTAAVTSKSDISNITSTGTTNLGLTVTNANAYPINFTLAMSGSGSVTVSIFTASPSGASTAKSVVWERTFTSGGDIGALIEPNITKSGSTSGNRLYVKVSKSGSPTFTISNFVIGAAGVPTARASQFDVDGDGKDTILDLVILKKMAVGSKVKSWLGDLCDNGVIAEADDLTELTKGLLGSYVTATKGDRALVWNEEFNGNSVNTDHFSFPYDGEGAYSTHDENVNVSGGTLNLNITRADGYNLAKPSSVVTEGKLSFNKGYLEIRAKMTANDLQSLAYWLTSRASGDHSENYGEYDIVETFSTGFRPNIHVWNWEGRIAQYAENITSYNYTTNNFNKTQYHIFGFEWDSTSIKFYVDGTVTNTISISSLTSSNASYADILDDYYSLIIVNGAKDTITYDSILPGCSVDYIRLYQKSGESFKINGVVQ